MASNHGTSGMPNSDTTHPSQNIGHHLNRLHRRAQQQQVMQTGTPTPTPMVDPHGRPSSVMSDMTAPTPTNPPMPTMATQMPSQGGQSGVRRASDPVRTLDRNFGVEGQMSRHNRSGSFSHGNMMGQANRVPVHGQRIRGMSGDTFFHQPQPMVRNIP